MKNKFKKGIALLLACNVVASTVALNFPHSVAATEKAGISAKSSTRSVTVEPVNLLKDPAVTASINKFNSWDTYHQGELLTNMSKDGKGAFVLDGANTVIPIGDGVRFWAANGSWSWITQKVSVIKGEKYRLSFNLRDNSESLLLTYASLIYQLSPVASSESNVPAKFTFAGNNIQSVDYTADKTQDIYVSLGGVRGGGLGSAILEIRNISFINTDITPPEKPQINPIYTDKNLVAGKAEPNTTIIATTEKGNVFETTTDDNGEYALKLKEKQIVGRKVTVVNKDVAGNISDPVTLEVRQGDLMLPELNEVNNKSTTVTGAADVSTSVVVKVIKPDLSELTYDGATNEDGDFSIEIPAPEYGDKIKAYTKALGKVSPIAETDVKDVIKPEAPTVDEVDAETTSVTGKGVVGNKIKVVLPDANSSVVLAEVTKNGTFAAPIPKQKEGAKILVSQIKPSGLESEQAEITVKDIIEEKGTITPNKYTSGTGYIKGSYTGDITKARVTVNGTALKPGGDFKNGTFSYYVGSNVKAGDSVKIQAYSKKDKLLDTQPVEVVTTVKGTIIPNSYEPGDTLIEGTYTGEVAKGRLLINGKVQSSGGDFAAGKFTYYVGTGKIKTGDKVQLEALSKTGELLDTKEIKVNGSLVGKVIPNPYKLGDAYVTGKYEGQPATGRVTINGKKTGPGGDFNADGTFRYYVGSSAIKTGNDVKIAILNKAGEVIDEQPIPISGATAGTITPNTYTLGEQQITGSYTGDVAYAVVNINGKAQKPGGDFKAGKFTYYVGAKIKFGDQVRIDAYDKSGKLLESGKPVTVSESKTPGTATVDAYKLGSVNITGSYTGEIARAKATVNGVEQKVGGTFTGGKFTYYIGAKIKSEKDVVTITFYDKYDVPLVKNEKVQVSK